jgi:glycosyltransferase involved in cell wall biosynthesis
VIIANSRATIAEFLDYPSAYRKRMTLIEHGIPPPTHVLAPADVRQKFKLPGTAPLLLMAARLDMQKGHHLIVDALRDLPGVHLAMAGSGPELDNLRAQAAANGCLDRLHFLGHVGRQDLTDLYRAATLMVFPSTWETFGLAAVEAAMVGLPIVSSDIPALREVLTVNGETTARFVQQRTSAIWASAIADSLRDPTLRSRSEHFALAIQDKYSEERMIDGYVSLYAELFR